MASTVVTAGSVYSGTVANGDFVTIPAGAQANRASVEGGSLTIAAGASSTNTTENMGFLFVYGASNGDVVEGGGFATVEAGATATNLTLHAIGYATIYGQVNGLALDGRTYVIVAPGASISGLSFTMTDTVKLDEIPFIAGATTSIDPKTDLLTISGNGQTETVQLAGDFSGKVITTAADAGTTASGAASRGRSSKCPTRRWQPP